MSYALKKGYFFAVVIVAETAMK